MHLAETPEELQLLRSGDGPLRIFLEELGVWNAAMLEPGRCPLDYLSTLVSAHRAIVVHGGCLDGEEIRFLAENQEHMGVVYCPRTHQWFGRRPYPLESMLAAGVPVALGTDGRGSSPDLNIMAEMRCVAQHHPSIPLPRILQMGTLDGASVLGCDAVTGSLTPGKQADLAVIALPRLAVSDPHDLLFHAEASFATCGCRGSA
jgi:cytosine/adenosine deaminase-related metal-dependent hydrolase